MKAKKDSIVGFIVRVFALLSNEERKKSGLLLAGIVVNSFVDLLGLAVVIPVIGLVVNPSVISSNALLADAFALSHSIKVANPAAGLGITRIPGVSPLLQVASRRSSIRMG